MKYFSNKLQKIVKICRNIAKLFGTILAHVIYLLSPPKMDERR